MRRIMIVGSPGAGKSSLAVDLGRRLNLPVHHLERICFRRGWRWAPAAERDVALTQIFSQPGYVLEGNYPQTYPARLADCDTLIWLDLPFLLRLYRVCRRVWLHRGTERADLPEGSTETEAGHQLKFWRYFLMDRLIRGDTRSVLAAKAPEGVRVVRLASRSEVRAFLTALK